MTLVGTIKERTSARLAAARERARPKPPVLPSYDEPPDLDAQWQAAVSSVNVELQIPDKE